jgi:hypothetical protein
MVFDIGPWSRTLSGLIPWLADAAHGALQAALKQRDTQLVVVEIIFDVHDAPPLAGEVVELGKVVKGERDADVLEGVHPFMVAGVLSVLSVLTCLSTDALPITQEIAPAVSHLWVDFLSGREPVK